MTPIVPQFHITKDNDEDIPEGNYCLIRKELLVAILTMIDLSCPFNLTTCPTMIDIRLARMELEKE